MAEPHTFNMQGGISSIPTSTKKGCNMPKSQRCGECNLPIKSHNRTAWGTRRKALIVTAKIRKYGNKKPVLHSWLELD